MAEHLGLRFSCHRCEAWVTLRTSDFISLSCSFIAWKNGDHLLAPFSDGIEEMLKSIPQWCALEAVPLVERDSFKSTPLRYAFKHFLSGVLLKLSLLLRVAFFFLSYFYVILAMGLKT